MKFIWSLIFPAILIGSTEGTANEIANDFINAVGNGGNTGQRMHRKGMTMMKGGGSKKTKQISNKKIGGGLRVNKQKLNGLPSFMLPESSPDQTVATEQDIIDGSWLLFNLEFEDEIHTDGGSDYKGQVYGLFCKIDLSTQKEDPSKVPFFMNFVREGKCKQPGNHVKLDLYDIVQKTRAYDVEHANDALESAKSIEPTAFFYHEGRCGSTLVSNSATALDPERTRTYSEPMPLLLALLDCDKTRANCNIDKAANLFRDVVYMMGRTSNSLEDRMFFKLLPSSILGVSVVKKAFPNVPWAFIYRDPLHVMVSNLREKHADKAPGPYCTGLKKNKYQSEYIQDLVLNSGKSVEELTREEYCAAYLATLTEAAVEEIAYTEGGMGINYAEMPEILIEKVFPDHFGLPVGEEEKKRVLSQFGVYSKRMKRKDPKEAKDDSAEKENEASMEVRQAVGLFLNDSYGKLQLLNTNGFVPEFSRHLTDRFNEVNEVKHSTTITLYDPQLAFKQRRLQTTPTFCDVEGATICCPLGSTATVTQAGPTTVTVTTTGGGISTYNTCFFSYPACSWSTVGDCPFYTTTQASSACSGLSYFYSTTTAFYEAASEFCPATASPTSSSSPSSSPTLMANTSSPTLAPTSSPTLAPTSSPTSSPTLAPTSSPTSSPTLSPTSTPTGSPTLNPTIPGTVVPTSGPSSAPTRVVDPGTNEPTLGPTEPAPTDTPTMVPTTSPTAEPTDTPTSAPTITAMPTTSSAPTGTPTITAEPTNVPTSAPTTSTAPTLTVETLSPTLAFCGGTTPMCPATLTSGSSKGSRRNLWEESSVPICTVTQTTTGIKYETMCMTPSELEALSTEDEDEDDDSGKGKMMGMMGGMKKKKKKTSKSKGSAPAKFDSYTCGCCDPLLEGDGHPAFCVGEICAMNPTPCGRGRFLKHKNRMNKKKKKKMDMTGMMKKKVAGSRGKRESSGVTICVDGETVCVDELDPMYLGMDAPAYTCGPC